MCPLFTGYACDDGSVSPLTLEHYGQIAHGGPAMIVVANACVCPGGALSKNSLRADDDRFIPGLGKLAETIKKEKCAAVLQINHGGRFSISVPPRAPSAVAIKEINPSGFYRVAMKSQDLEKKWSILTEALEKETPVEMTAKEIKEVIGAYADAAVRAKRAGFDMVEIHGGTGYLPVQFLSPRTNRRKDDYGGSEENRMRFCLELVAETKAAVGDDFPVGYRFLADEWMPGGFAINEAERFARRLENLGIAYLSVTAGVYESFMNPEIIERMKEPCYMVDLAGKVGKAVKTTIIANGRIATPELAEQVLERKEADLVGLARPLLVDPDWAEKARTGKADTIRECKNCGACFRMVVANRPVLCAQFERQKRVRIKQILKEMRNPNKKVLIAMDGSENAAMGVAYAGDLLSRAEGVRIGVVHIRTEESEDRADEIRRMMETARNILLEKKIPEEAVTIIVKKMRNGVAKDLLDEISAGGYGTVVVGRRGLSRARRLLFGSVSNKIVQSAKGCTVWVVDG